MKKWSTILEENWDSVVDAMGKAAVESTEGAGDAEARVLLSQDGEVSVVWEFPNTITAGQKHGTERKIISFLCGEWEKDYAQSWADGCEMDTPESFLDLLLIHWKMEEELLDEMEKENA